MPQFSTHEAVSLEKNVNLKNNIIQTNFADIDDAYELQRCADWIRHNGFQKVCLQFPDHLLPDSTEVALKLQKLLGQTIYILGDTAYESCCIDYIAAAHVNGDAIIHFGPICFSKTLGNLPSMNIYEKHPIDFVALEKAFSLTFPKAPDNGFVMVLDDAYIHSYENIKKLFGQHSWLDLHRVDEELANFSEKHYIFVTSNERKLLNVSLTLKPQSLYYFDPTKPALGICLFEPDSKILKRRYFLMEKIRDAHTIGIVIGTLGVQNYLRVIERVKKLAKLSGKKYYLISVGKPTVAKLANLGEIDIYVMITCSMNEIYDNRDFYKPIVTPYDVEMALNSNTNNIQFTFDYNWYLNNLDNDALVKNNENDTDVSLLTGKLRCNNVSKDREDDKMIGNSVALRSDGTVANSNFGAGFLNERCWKGLEQSLGQTEVKLAEEGRKGIAQGYQNEQI